MILDAYDNAQAERINNTMKNGLLKDKVFRSMEEVIASVALAVDFYFYRVCPPFLSTTALRTGESFKSHV